MQLLKTATSRSTRYYIDGKRVSRATYEDATDYGRLCSLQTVRIRDGWRYYATVSPNRQR